MRVIAADKILTDFGLRLSPKAKAKSKIFARILSLLKGAEASSHSLSLYNQLSIDLLPVEHILVDNNPETQ